MKPTSHFEWIDVLRGLSALGIVLFHVRVNLWVGWAAIHTSPHSFSLFDRAAAWLSIPLPFLGPAVMLFFLVSGFCVHYPHAAGGRTLGLSTYGSRRFLRIYPPYLFIILLCVLIEWILSQRFGQETSAADKVFRTLFMVQNYGPDAGQIVSNPSLWSLPVEVELYLMYPIFYWLLRRTGIKWSLLIACLVSLGAMGVLLAMGSSNGTYLTGNFALYWIIWCSGAALAELVKRDQLPQWRREFWGIMAATFCLGMFVHFLKVPSALEYWVWSGFYFMVVLWGLTCPEPLRLFGFRTRRFLSTLGLMSYSLYLIHFPFFMLCGAFWIRWFGSKPTNFLVPLAFTMLCLPIAYAMYARIEVPSHRLARKLGSREASTKSQVVVTA